MRNVLFDLAAFVAVSAITDADDTHSISMAHHFSKHVGRTPALGWNSWNTGACDAATAEFALQTAHHLQSLGLQDLGYTFVNIDDCWATKDLDTSGNLVPDPIKWPQGIQSIANQIHAKGLKFGLYGCAGVRTCADFPGSHGHEQKHAAQIAAWGVDYWKYDNCYTPCNGNNLNPSWCTTPKGNTQTWYKPMRDALQAQSRPILFSLCQWGRDDVWKWGSEFGNSWRMSGDIANDGWASINRIGSVAGTIAQYAGPYGFNDLDMLEIGNGNLTEAESRTHFGLWGIAKSPLIIGTDLNKISKSDLDILKNQCIIQINQDSLGKAAGYFKPSGAANWVDGQLYPYWAGALSDGVVIGLIATEGQTTLSVDFKDVPGLDAGTYKWTECWSGTSGEGTSVSFNLKKHDMAVVKVFASSKQEAWWMPIAMSRCLACF